TYFLQHLRPEQTPGTHLGHFHEQVHADAPEEAQAWREFIHAHARCDASAHVFDTIGERVGQFQIGGCTGLVHVIAAYADAVELRHFARAVAEDVTHDAHARTRWIDVGVAHHELLEDVVLDGALQLFRLHTLFFRGNDEESHDR